MTVELKSRLWVDHRSEKWTNNRPIKIEAIPLTSTDVKEVRAVVFGISIEEV